jgi:hypothetical protein
VDSVPGRVRLFPGTGSVPHRVHEAHCSHTPCENLPVAESSSTSLAVVRNPRPTFRTTVHLLPNSTEKMSSSAAIRAGAIHVDSDALGEKPSGIAAPPSPARVRADGTSVSAPLAGTAPGARGFSSAPPTPTHGGKASTPRGSASDAGGAGGASALSAAGGALSADGESTTIAGTSAAPDALARMTEACRTILEVRRMREDGWELAGIRLWRGLSSGHVPRGGVGAALIFPRGSPSVPAAARWGAIPRLARPHPRA